MRIPFFIITLACLTGLLFSGPLLPAEPASQAPSNSHDLLAEALPILKSNYIDPKAIEVKAGENLKELIAQSDGKISLGSSAASPAPIVTAFLPGNIIYWRLASFSPSTNWTDLTAQLDQWTRQGAEGMILDLRSNVTPDDYKGAAQVASLFTLSGTCFYLKKGLVITNPGQDNPSLKFSFHQPLVMVTNNQTSGAAEALASCLKLNGALVVGRSTKGKAAFFEEQTLTSGQILRYAVGQVCLANGTPLWGHPVNPDIGLTVDEQTEKNALALIEQHGVLDVIHESAERRRLNEASLVQGEDPELDDYLASHEKKVDTKHAATSPLFQDVALIDAMDSLKAIQLSQRRTISSPGSVVLPETASSIQ